MKYRNKKDCSYYNHDYNNPIPVTEVKGKSHIVTVVMTQSPFTVDYSTDRVISKQPIDITEYVERYAVMIDGKYLSIDGLQTINKILEKTVGKHLSDHKCLGIIPGDVMIPLWRRRIHAKFYSSWHVDSAMILDALDQMPDEKLPNLFKSK